MLLNRYLGNKAALLEPILELTATKCRSGDRVLDIFAGSLAVSMAYKNAGYQVTANDVNLLTTTFGMAYLVNSSVPSFPLEELVTRSRVASLRRQADHEIEESQGREGFEFLNVSEHRSAYRDLVATLMHLQLVEEDELPARFRRSDFFDAYCPEGRFSAFRSSRGSSGRRRFLTAENARRLDLILNQIRYWRSANLLSDWAHSLALAVTCYALEKVANTQGTYHDFPRDIWDSRALKPLTLSPPPLDSVLTGCASGHSVHQMDSVDFIERAGHHRLMYVDPPYNFRQYTAYYFLPNLVSRYPDLEDPDEYFSSLKFVRGQNPSDDYTSPFCSSRRFLDAMRGLIAAADVDSVLISYFTGRNHWSDFDSTRDDTGLNLLSELLNGDAFVKDSLQIVEVERRNYASYGGYRARRVAELLLLADKRSSHRARRKRGEVPGPGIA